MAYLIISVLLSAGIFLLFQWFARASVNTFQAIVVNYGVAGTIGWNLAGGKEVFQTVSDEGWVCIALGMGALFIYLFDLIARSTQENGITVTSIAAKLSMVIPVAIFLLYDPEDQLNWKKGTAIALAVPAIVLASLKEGATLGMAHWRMPIVIFIGSGLIDWMFAGFSGEAYMQSVEHRYLFAALPLMTACVCGLVWLGASGLQNRAFSMPNRRTWVGGIVLGIINFGSLYFLLETYDKVGIDRSAVMPVNNLGIILLSAALSVALLGEKLKPLNYLGLSLGIVSIALLLWEAL